MEPLYHRCATSNLFGLVDELLNQEVSCSVQLPFPNKGNKSEFKIIYI